MITIHRNKKKGTVFAQPKMHRYYANNNDPLIPEWWAAESVQILIESMVLGSLVHRDFEMEFARGGDVVHTRKPAALRSIRKTDSDNITIQDVASTDILVPLDQWFHTSFIIKDGEQTKSFKNLVDFYLRPAIVAHASALDRVLSGQAYRFLGNIAGNLGLGSSSTIRGYMVDARTKMNINKAPLEGRNLVVTPYTEGHMLNTDLFVSAEKVGDNGTALRNASIGRKLGFDVFMAQNQPNVAYMDKGTTALNDAGMVAGDTVVTLAAGHNVVAGTYLIIAGDNQPQLVLSVSTNDATISPGLTRTATLGMPASNAVVTRFMPGLVKGAGFLAGWSKEVTVDAFDATNGPQVGQMIRFGADNTAATIASTVATYSIIEVTAVGGGEYNLLLDRPLEVALTDNGLAAVGPSGDYNFAFTRNALALVNRPLVEPPPGHGVRTAVAQFGNVAFRVTMGYDIEKQGIIVTVDSLSGVAVLDTALGCVMLG